MVQEFTGVPSAPFSGGSPYSRRMDLFSAASALRSAANLDGIGPIYPLRPVANKILSPFSSAVAPPSQLLNSTMIDSIAPTATITNASSASKSSINLSGFSASASAAAQHGDRSRWKRVETVRNNDLIHEFDGNNNNINIGESLNYNLNGEEKGMENAASSIAEGTVAS
ncbi:hypothetical protein SASPL_105497 [Salvia splendens]|uniref:Uncharacterized protein n=1 Tax=Salvia splendens TaxID=180675 RepID=A0A8X8YQJ3_SALSN|nr:hypothetical protein SASPL_105497 [Salvia splendens]